MHPGPQLLLRNNMRRQPSSKSTTRMPAMRPCPLVPTYTLSGLLVAIRKSPLALQGRSEVLPLHHHPESCTCLKVNRKAYFCPCTGLQYPPTSSRPGPAFSESSVQAAMCTTTVTVVSLHPTQSLRSSEEHIQGSSKDTLSRPRSQTTLVIICCKSSAGVRGSSVAQKRALVAVLYEGLLLQFLKGQICNQSPLLTQRTSLQGKVAGGVGHVTADALEMCRT